MRVSVVVPVYNAKRTIERCLVSLINQNFNDYEIIIVDNGSNDGSFGLIEESIRAHPEEKIKLIREEKKGPSEARNRGIKDASGDIVAFTDSDCVADRDWLRDIVNAFDKEEIGAVAGNIRGYKSSNLIEKFLSLYTLRGLEKSQTFKEYTLVKGGFSTTNLFFRQEILRKAGGFDKSMRWGEDHDMCARIYKMGYKIRYITQGVIYHLHRSTLGSLIKQSFGFGKAHAMLLHKWGKHRLIIEFPKYTYQNPKFGLPIWLNLNYADKKMAIFIILGFFNSILFILPVVYFLYLCIDMKKEYERQEIRISLPERIGLTFLLLIKSIAMTCGRIYGSFKNRVICI